MVACKYAWALGGAFHSLLVGGPSVGFSGLHVVGELHDRLAPSRSRRPDPTYDCGYPCLLTYRRAGTHVSAAPDASFTPSVQQGPVHAVGGLVLTIAESGWKTARSRSCRLEAEFSCAGYVLVGLESLFPQGGPAVSRKTASRG